MNANRIPYISELKAIATLMIVITHYSQAFNCPFINSWLAIGQIGVQIFLLLSSFTLSISITKKTYTYTQFIKRRIKRIAIPYWLTILFYIVCGLSCLLVFHYNPIQTNLSPVSIFLNILFLNGLFPFCNNNVVLGGWYIGTIFILYIFHPLLFNLYQYMNSRFKNITRFVFPMLIAFMGGISILVISLLTQLPIENNSFLYFSFLNQIGCYSLGFVLCDIWNTNDIYKIKYSIIISILLLVLGGFLFYSNLALAPMLFPTVFGIAFLFFVTFLLQREKIKPHKEFKIFIIVEELSFSIYLTHIFVVKYFASISKKILGLFINSETVLFVVILPISLMLVFIISKLFSIIVNRIEMKIYNH